MRKEEENSEGKFPWLEDTNERKYMTEKYWTNMLIWTTHA